MLIDITSLLSKDKLVAQALRALIEGQLDGLGTVSGIDFNSSAKSLKVTLAEQRRIVAKVEQLMALVDALETQLAAFRATASNLLSTLVAELTRLAADKSKPLKETQGDLGV